MKKAKDKTIPWNKRKYNLKILVNQSAWEQGKRENPKIMLLFYLISPNV